MTDRWFIATTQPSAEQKAANWLLFQGYESFLPECVETVFRKGVPYQRRAKMYPNYLFTLLNDDPESPDFGTARRTYGVTGLLSEAGFPRPISNDVVHELQDRANEDGGIISLEKPFRFHESLRVVPVHDDYRLDPWAGFEGRYLREAKNRVTLLLSVFGRSTIVELDRAQVAR